MWSAENATGGSESLKFQAPKAIDGNFVVTAPFIGRRQVLADHTNSNSTVPFSTRRSGSIWFYGFQTPRLTRSFSALPWSALLLVEMRWKLRRAIVGSSSEPCIGCMTWC